MSFPPILNLSTELLIEIFDNFRRDANPKLSGLYVAASERLAPPRYLPTSPPRHHTSRHNLVSLCLVSRRFRDVAQSILFRELTLGYGLPWNDVQFAEWNLRLLPFSRTIAEREDLAAAVRSIAIMPKCIDTTWAQHARNRIRALVGSGSANQPANAPNGGQDHEEKSDFSSSLRAIIDSLNPDSSHPEHDDENDDDADLGEEDQDSGRSEDFDSEDGDSEDWVSEDSDEEHLDEEDLDEEDDDEELARHPAQVVAPSEVEVTVLIAAMLARLPNLEHFCLENGGRWPPWQFPKSGLQSMGISTLPLKSLHATVDCSSIIQLSPGLEDLTIHNAYLDFDAKDFPVLPRLRILRLMCMNLTRRDLATVLGCCTGKLENFAYEATSRGTEEHFLPSDARKSLLPHQETLRTLHLDLSHRRTLYEHCVTVPHFTLQDFEALEEIFLSANVISAPEDRQEGNCPPAETLLRLLPKSTVILRVRQIGGPDTVRLKRGLWGIADLADKQGGTDLFLPNLRTIRCSLKRSEPLWNALFHAGGMPFSMPVWTTTTRVGCTGTR